MRYLKHSQRAERAVKEPEILKRRGDRRLLRPVWVATQGVDLWASVGGEPTTLSLRPVWVATQGLDPKARLDNNPRF
ncbi:hypothetical protein CKQ54_13500 [Rahnella variigena]|uniref:Uncharacterized protein n=1 Tax=Rahnella variigena TaxID=574964 RepID=A0ABX9PXE4_9GAMM|nr:hypothetical protein D6D38_24105 [Rahnella variigena]RKF69318.1 hypothetical protein CKQ54_13500 [Rahnella variigena]